MRIERAEPRVLMVRNAEGSGPGRLLPWLDEAGLDVVEVPGSQAPDGPAGYDAVVLLGGGLLPDDDVRAPWLPAERLLARRSVERQVPLLGICLGAQVLAVAVGGEVRGAYGAPERGACRVRLRAGAVRDPLLAGLPPEFHAMQNHRDQITRLPPGARHLAESPDCRVQAFRVGACAWGVQFHPEAGADRLRGWDEAALAEAGVDLTALRVQAEAVEPDSARAAHRLVANFAALVLRGARPGTSPDGAVGTR